MLTTESMTPAQIAAARLALSLVHASEVGVEQPGSRLVDGFGPHGEIIVNGVMIRAIDAVNAAAHLAASTLVEHAEDPTEALTEQLRLLSIWEAEHE